MSKPLSKFVKKRITLSSDIFEVESALASNKMIVSELTAYLAEDNSFLDWLNLEPQHEFVREAMESCAIPNKRGEYDNLDFTIQSAWSKQKGIGKTSVATTLKLIGDEVIQSRKFVHDEVFFYPKAKIEYVKKNVGKLTNRYLLLDEMLPQFGASSKADMYRLKNIDTTSRINGFNNYYVSPEGFTMGLSTDYILLVFLKDLKHEMNLCMLAGRKGNVMGPIALKIPPKRIWNVYQEKKQEFRTAVDSGKIIAFDVKDLIDELDEKFRIRDWFKKELDFSKEMTIHKLNPKDSPKPKPVRKLIEYLESLMLSINQQMTEKELRTYKQLIILRLEDEFKTG